MQRRKVTFKLYPTAAQARTLEQWTALHCELYNAALEERIDAYRKKGHSVSYFDQQNTLPEIKEARPEFKPLGSHALQQTLRRLDEAFKGFFRRVKAGQKPGFPRFKSAKRFSGFTYPDPAGWSLNQEQPNEAKTNAAKTKPADSIKPEKADSAKKAKPEKSRNKKVKVIAPAIAPFIGPFIGPSKGQQKCGSRRWVLRLGSGQSTMQIRLRGRHRFGSDLGQCGLKPNDLTLTRKSGHWMASVTLRVPDEACARVRTANELRGVDLGLNDWATFENGQTVQNPRWVQTRLPQLALLQRQRARKKRGSVRCKRLSRQIARLHQDIGHLRLDFIHKQTSRLAQTCALIATEELNVKAMSSSGRTRNSSGKNSRKKTHDKPRRQVRQKAGLNREILSAGWSMAHQMLRYKAAEAGTRLHLSNTRQLKPSQRCSSCWELTRKTLSDRVHVCRHCGFTLGRDQNSARVVLVDAYVDVLNVKVTDVKATEANATEVKPDAIIEQFHSLWHDETFKQYTSGTDVTARPKPLDSRSAPIGARSRAKSKSVTRETPTKKPLGV